MERYDSYKDSGVDWIGEIPSHWRNKKIWTLFRPVSRKNTEGEVNLSVYRDYGVIPRDSRDDNHNRVSEDTSNYKLVEVGDFVLNKMKCWMGSLGLSDYRGIVSPSYTVLTPLTGDNHKFLHFLLRSNVYIPEYRRLSYGVRIGQWDLRFEDFRDIPTVIPPLHEQEQIVEYLDRKTTLIDSLIERTVRKIELLKEKNLKIIEQITTSTSTERVRLSSIVHVSERPVNRNQGGKFTKIGLFNWGRGIFCYPEESGDDLGDSSFSFLKNGDLIISGQFAWEGAISIVDEEFEGCICSHRFHVLNGIRNVVSNGYLWAFFTSQEGTFLLRENSSGSAGRNRPLNLGKLLKEKVPLPPIRDQILVEQLVHDYSQFKKHAEQKVNLLKEYRQSLISEVVTGKVKVAA